jgi:hypothetical protein
LSIAAWVFIGSAAIVAGLVVGEIILRLLQRSLRPLTEWQNWEMHHRIAALNDLARMGGASVVVVGSSMVNAAVDPDRLSALLDRTRPAFNAGLNGAGARLLELWTLRIVLPRLRPSVVVIGLGSHEVSSGNVIARRLLDSLLTSSGWRDLEGGGSFMDRLIRWFGKRSFLVRYRSYLGRRALFRDTPTRRSSTCRRLGTLRTLLLFRFRSYRIDDRQLKMWNQLLENFEVGEAEMTALGRLIEGVRAAGAIPVLIRMPVTGDWVQLHPGGRSDFEQFERTLSSFARERSVPYADLASKFLSLEDYADPVHLNGKGLLRFTNLLAVVIKDVEASPAAESYRGT